MVELHICFDEVIGENKMKVFFDERRVRETAKEEKACERFREQISFAFALALPVLREFEYRE